MRKSILIIIFLLILSGCKEVKLPTSSNPIEPIEPPPKTAAQVSYYDYNLNFYPDINDPRKAEFRIWGWLRNSGDLPAKNIKIHSTIYDRYYNIRWQGEFLFINPSTNSSYLAGKEICEFVVSWKGLDMRIFYDPPNGGEWSHTTTLGSGIKITWE
jgi:hypothetical protein